MRAAKTCDVRRYQSSSRERIYRDKPSTKVYKQNDVMAVMDRRERPARTLNYNFPIKEEFHQDGCDDSSKVLIGLLS